MAAVDPAPAAPSDPRGILLADLVARVAGRIHALARHYESAAALADGALRDALLHLAARKRAQALALGPLARSLAVAAEPSVPAAAAGAPRWGVVLGAAFASERSLETAARELGALTGDPAVEALGARLAADAAGDQEAVRKLYLRYT